MVIKIQTEKPAIPIEFGALKFSFDTSDEGIRSFQKGAEVIQKELDSIASAGENDVQFAKKILRKGYDHMLGKGAFDKIYEQTPSVIQLTNHFVELSEAIKNKLDQMGLSQTQQKKVDRYLQNKNRNSNRNHNRKK